MEDAFVTKETLLENKAGEKVTAGEALQGKVVALYVRGTTLNRTPCSGL